MAYLVVTSKGKELYRRELAGPVTLGRSTDCELWLNDTGVSRKHCRFEPAGDGWEVHDLGSRNGVFVHGEPVTKHVLRDGDVVRIGEARIRFYEVGFVSARPAAPTRSSDPMSETIAHPEIASIGPKPRPAPRPATPGRK
ncbi:MAG: FHA domain-containing protein, partial [Tepidisphaeraceae bacterium]